MTVPFFRVELTEEEIQEVTACLRRGWLTSGPNCRKFEQRMAEYVGVPHAIAVNSCTAALHLALEAIGVRRGDYVLVPTLTFAATAEVVRYLDATPVLVDCEPDTLCMDPEAAAHTLRALHRGEPIAGLEPPYGPVRAMIPVHYGGQMADMPRLMALAREYNLVVVEDAAHTLPAYLRESPAAPWKMVGTTGDITCFSFYANKCITTGEGGMAVTANDEWAERIRLMSLHGLSRDAWSRFEAGGHWYYEIAAPGFKYNLTDMAAALGWRQLERAEQLWLGRRRVAELYRTQLGGLTGICLPTERPDRKHSWHLYSARLNSPHDRDRLIDVLQQKGIGTSVHWMPLHCHPYYRKTYGYREDQFPVAAREWKRMVSLPIFAGMTESEVNQVTSAVGDFLT